MNRIPAKMKGGRNAKPIFIPSHVEPQMIQRAVKTKLGAFDGNPFRTLCVKLTELNSGF